MVASDGKRKIEGRREEKVNLLPSKAIVPVYVVEDRRPSV